ncbi:MAG TPA: class I SAM-dependent methyltransferase [Propionicimonas sp.]
MAGTRVGRRAPRRTHPSRTAWGAALCRLIEQGQPPVSRLFNDPVVGRLLDPRTVAMADGPMRELYLSELGSGTYGAQIMRTRYIDDVVNGLVEGGTTQVVILGAGFDTRAFRLPVLAGATVLELDLPATQQYKVEHLRDVPKLAARVKFIPTDFTTDPLCDVLGAAGLDSANPVLFVWEGVTQYLPEAAVRSTLACVGASVPGSALVFTYVRRSIIDGSAWDPWSDEVRPRLDASEPWIFGLEPGEVPGLLDSYGLSLVDDVGKTEFRSRYAEPLGRRVALNEVERVALAVVRTA